MSDEFWLEYIKAVKKINNRKIRSKNTTNNNIYNIKSLNSFNADKIDLHGMNQEQAFEQLNWFLSNAYENYKKEVLIITGKGSENSPSIFKLVVPRWLKYTELNKYVRDYFTAMPNRGGEGAITVLIRKRKD